PRLDSMHTIVIARCMRVYARISFFFQAEDGIRDPLVTGVQTCALPISLRLLPARHQHAWGKVQKPQSRVRPRTWGPSRFLPSQRSEERRVGKECRSRWWREHRKENEV